MSDEEIGAGDGWISNTASAGKPHPSTGLPVGTIITADLRSGFRVQLKKILDREPLGEVGTWVVEKVTSSVSAGAAVRDTEIAVYRIESLPTPKPTIELHEALERAEAERDEMRGLLGHIYQIAGDSAEGHVVKSMGRIRGLTQKYRPQCTEELPTPTGSASDLAGIRCERELHPVDAPHRGHYTIDGILRVDIEWRAEA